MEQQKGNGWALLPLGVFLVLFVGSGIITGDFYKLPVLVAIIIAAIVALAMNRKDSLNVKVERFAKGAGHPDIIIMVLIFILAGAFSQVAKGMGAVDSTVNLALSVLPQSLVVVGIFVIGAFISISMGTSMGTIAALGPIAVGISEQAHVSITLAIAAVVGGAMFGDNLSVISDTTIAAVRTQKTNMSDKLKVNFFIVLPAAIVTVILLLVMTLGNTSSVEIKDFSWFKILPYVGVLVAAIFGANVLSILTGGIVLASVIGLADGSYTLSSLAKTVTEGIGGMSELIILSLLIGGMVELIRYNGGIQFLLNLLTRRIQTKKGGEFSIAGLVSLTNLATANNTISIITAGPLAKEISDKYSIDNRKSASLLDLFSCSVQGLIPYGAQMLLAAGFAKVSPIEIIPFTFYPMLTAVCGVIAIVIGFPRLNKKSKSSKEAA
ncbi:Na+/H+ antiporter NhaC family protein [Priestia megaterium]|uniref:Na+/H+ antiporter NhaC family protein n=1 Tax=Priestia megaterium TaxID=1404 RepID=UPI000C9D2465|nr:Na+/H+ antiporter NhaC family protein [Priestia megaterium]MCU7744518.1 Na+/H+ antiporter NhaC family protein [Priestia megaterium]PNE07690.1 sodium:proton antiporter [Priestia megaterium]